VRDVTDAAVRVALVGYGSAGRGIHAPLLTAAGVPPAVVVSANQERAAQARADLQGVEVVSDVAAAVESAPDLVVIASPSGVHVANALACVEAGVGAVVVDKPLAVRASSARQIVDAARDAGVALTVFQNRRWDAENLTLKRLLAQGALGQVHRFERRWERWRPVAKDRWRENASADEGGGILLDLHPHLVDAAVHLFGPVVEVYAEVAAWTTLAEDDAFVSLLHTGRTWSTGDAGGTGNAGAPVRSHLSATSVAGAPGPRTRVLGSAGAYVVTTFENEASGFTGVNDDVPGCSGWLVAGEQRRPVPTEPGGHGDFYPAVLEALARADAAARQAAMPVNPEDAVHVLTVIDAARRSAVERSVVSLTPARRGQSPSSSASGPAPGPGGGGWLPAP